MVPLNRAIRVRGEMAISGLSREYLEGFYRKFPRTIQVSTDVKTPGPAEVIKIEVMIRGGEAFTVFLKRNAAGFLSASFFDFFGYIKRFCLPAEGISSPVSRAVNVKKRAGCGHIRIRDISLADLLFAARQGFRFPAGLLHFEHRLRIVGIDYPLTVLQDKVSPREKERFLYDLVNLRISSGYSRFIKSGVYILNY